MAPRLWTIGLVLGGLLACTASGPNAKDAPVVGGEGSGSEAQAGSGVAELGDLDPTALAGAADKKAALVPSPVETQRALEAAGIATQLSSLVPADRAFDNSTANADHIALRTGVVIADLLLTCSSADDATLIARMGVVREGMDKLKGGEDIVRTIDDMIERTKAGALQRDALLKELEELSQVAVPELTFQGVERIVPLIQAGSWTAGSNLVARAALQADKPAAVDAILKQPSVVTYFTEYARDNAAGAVPSEVASALQVMLAALQAVAEKQGPLTKEDVETVSDATTVVLSLL